MFTDYLKTEVQIWMFAILAVLFRVHAPQALAAGREQETRPVKAGGEVRLGREARAPRQRGVG
jgi:hypothetical protein